MKSIGKSLQFFGLVALPVAIMLQFTNSIGTKELLIAMLFGAAAFWLGRIIEGSAGGG